MMDEEEKNVECLPGFIFMCSGRTKPECYRYRVFGLPKGRLEVVQNIKPGSKLFLFDFELKLLYGVYEATSKPELDLEPFAFDTKFPVQVKFRIYKECLPLREKFFKQAIQANYTGNKFRPELTEPQVRELISLFRPLEGSSSSAHVPSLFFRKTHGFDPYLARTHLLHAPSTVNTLHHRDVQLLQNTIVEHRRQQAPNPYSGSGSYQPYFSKSFAHRSVMEFQSFPAQADPSNIPRSHPPLFTKVFAHHTPDQQNLPSGSGPYHVHHSQPLRPSNGHGQVITAPQNHNILVACDQYTSSHPLNQYLTEACPNGMTAMNDQNFQAQTARYGLPGADQPYYPVGVTNVTPEASSSSWTAQRTTLSYHFLGSGSNNQPLPQQDAYNPAPQSHQIKFSSVYSQRPEQENQTGVHQEKNIALYNYLPNSSSHAEPNGTLAVRAQSVTHQAYWTPQVPHETSVGSVVQPQTVLHQEAVASHNYQNKSCWMPTPYIPPVVEQQHSAPRSTQEVQLQNDTAVHQDPLCALGHSVTPYSAASGAPYGT